MSLEHLKESVAWWDDNRGFLPADTAREWAEHLLEAALAIETAWMTMAALKRRLRTDGFRPSDRMIDLVVGRLGYGHPGSGHRRVYSEMDYRRILSYLRIHRLVGGRAAASTRPRLKALHLEAVELLAGHTTGYVTVTSAGVSWDKEPPLDLLRWTGATCWPVWE